MDTQPIVKAEEAGDVDSDREDEIEWKPQIAEIAEDNANNKNQEEITNKSVVASAFESIYNIHKDKKALFEALKEAKTKLDNLEKQKEEVQRSINVTTNTLDTIVRQMKLLGQVTHFDPAENTNTYGISTSPDRMNASFIPNASSAVEHFVNQSPVCLIQQKKREELNGAINQTSRFIKMLKGAVLVMDDGDSDGKRIQPPLMAPPPKRRRRPGIIPTRIPG